MQNWHGTLSGKNLKKESNMRAHIITSIYKITSPSDKVYIGQSNNTKKRFWTYKNIICSEQVKLFHSLKKYGPNNHIFEIIHELPHDVSQEVINTYEQIYMDLYRDAGVVLLNIREGGSRGKLGEETLIKMRAANIGKKKSDSMKLKTSQRMIGKRIAIGNKHTDEWKKKSSIRHKGKKHALGKKHTPEMNARKSEIAKNQSIETRRKISNAVKLIWLKRKSISDGQ